MKNNWTLPEPTPEPTPKPTPKKRGDLFLSPEDMQEAKKSMKEKGIKAKDVKNLPPIEEIHGLNTPPLPKVLEVNSLMKFNDNDILTICILANAFISLKTTLGNKITSMRMFCNNSNTILI